MRADRLLSLMMLLQKNKQMTAVSLAKELEVSKRTIYRDIEALSVAGVPIYANGGPGGGYALLDGYRTTLTGLNENEVRTLFMVTLPGFFSDLGVSQDLKAIILKLTHSFSDRYQKQADYVHQRLHLDAARWFQPDTPLVHLKIVQEAIWQDCQLYLNYRRRNGIVSQRTLSPYGLVAKAGVWYLIADTDRGMRVYRVSRIEAVTLTETHFVRPSDFDLATFWENWVTDYKVNLSQYPVILRISPDLAPVLSYILGEQVQKKMEEVKPDADGWRTLTYIFERPDEACMFVLGMGDSVDVVAPRELRARVLQVAKDVVVHYSG